MSSKVVRFLPFVGVAIIAVFLFIFAIRGSQNSSGVVVGPNSAAVTNQSAAQGGQPDDEDASSGPTSTPLPPINACVIVPTADVEAVIGKLKVAPAAVDSTQREGSCIYTAANDLIVKVERRPDYIFNFRKVDKSTQALDGIGDAALVVTAPPIELWVLVKGQATIVITINNNDLVQASQLAQKFVAKLRG